MTKDKPGTVQVKTFADHKVITQPNPLRKVLRRVADKDLDDPIARAEKALAGLSGEFKNWMSVEADRLAAAHTAILKNGFTDFTREELFRGRCRRREPVPDHRTRAQSRRGAVRPDRTSYQRHPGHRARAHQARHRLDRERTEPAIARRRRRISQARQPRPPRAPRSHSCAEHCAGGLREIFHCVVPAKAGTHNPWRVWLRKVSAFVPHRDDTAYGSRPSPGRRRVCGVFKQRAAVPSPLRGRVREGGSRKVGARGYPPLQLSPARAGLSRE